MTFAGLALALVVTGCSEPDVGAGPTPLATPTAGSASPTSPTPTTTPPASATTTAPTASTSVPATARAHTSAGAEAFARFYFERVNQAFQGSGSNVLVGLYDPRCISCRNFAKNVDRLYNVRHKIEPAPYVVDVFTELPESTGELRIFSAALVHRNSNVIAADGSIVRKDREERTLVELALLWTNGGWIVRDLAQAKIINP